MNSLLPKSLILIAVLQLTLAAHIEVDGRSGANRIVVLPVSSLNKVT